MKYIEGEKLDLEGKEFIVYSKLNKIGRKYYYLMSNHNPTEMVVGKSIFNKPLTIIREQKEMGKVSNLFSKKYL